MLERRRSKRTKSYRGRVWVAAPTRCWADIRDASSGGMCIQLRTSVALGQTITVYRQLGARLGPGRVGTVVFVRGRSVGIRYSVDLASERRGALRHKTHGIRGWVSGPVETSAAIKNLSASGAAVAPMLPLRRGAKLTLSLLFGQKVVAKREAIVVRASSTVAGLRFLGSGDVDELAA